MDFIEQIFGLSPDGGDGTFETAIVVAVLAACAGLVAWRRGRTRR